MRRNEQLVVLVGDGRGGLQPREQTARCGAEPSNLAAADLNKVKKRVDRTGGRDPLGAIRGRAR